MSNAPRTVHFPMALPALEPAEKPVPENAQKRQQEPLPAKNPFDAYRDAAVSAKLIVDTLKTLFVSSNRHGDLQVVRSAARRIEADVTALIDLEETQ